MGSLGQAATKTERPNGKAGRPEWPPGADPSEDGKETPAGPREGRGAGLQTPAGPLAADSGLTATSTTPAHTTAGALASMRVGHYSKGAKGPRPRPGWSQAITRTEIRKGRIAWKAVLEGSWHALKLNTALIPNDDVSVETMNKKKRFHQPG